MRICWAPRTGRSKDFKRWQFDILDRLADIGYESIEQVLALEAPDKDALAQLAGDGGERRATRASNTEELFAQALEEYQAMNAKIYDIVHPSLIFIGTHEEDDLETIRKYRKGALKNGIGLLTWALQWTNTDSYEVQTALQDKLRDLQLQTKPNCALCPQEPCTGSRS